MSSKKKRSNRKSSNYRRQHCKILQEKVHEQEFYRRITKFSNRDKSQMEHTYIKLFLEERTYIISLCILYFKLIIYILYCDFDTS